MLAIRSEARHEKLDNPLGLPGECKKPFKARFPRPSRLRAKHYIAGVAYLGWKELIIHPGGRRYEATFAARRMEGSIEENLALGDRHPDVEHCIGGDHDLVLVSYIEALDGKQRPIPSMMWLGLSHETSRLVTGAGSNNFLPNGVFELREVTDDREVAASGIASASGNAGGNQVVESRPQVMDRIPGYQRNVCGQGAAVPNTVTITLRHWLDFWLGQIGIAVKKAPELGLKISDVAFRALQF